MKRSLVLLLLCILLVELAAFARSQNQAPATSPAASQSSPAAKRRMARGGKLDINIDYVKLTDGEKAALRAVKEVKGGGHTGAMTGGIVATSLVFFPAAPFFLFMHGKDISIPKGADYSNGDLKLDRAKFQVAESPTVASPAAPARVPAPPLRSCSWNPPLPVPTSTWTAVSSAIRRLMCKSRKESTPSQSRSRDSKTGSGS
jgi:hypothetical protein